MNNPMMIRRRSQNDIVADDASQSSDDSDYNKLGETLTRATKFFGTITQKLERKDSYEDPNLDIDRYRRSVGSTEGVENEANQACMEAFNEKYNEAKEGNLYKGLRSIRHTNDGMAGNDVGLDKDDFSCLGSLASESDCSMPIIDEEGGDDISSDEEKRSHDCNISQEGEKPNSSENMPEYIPARQMHRWSSDISMHSTRSASIRRCSNESEHSAIRRRDRLVNQQSDICIRRGSNGDGGHLSSDNRDDGKSRRETPGGLNNSGTGRGGLLRAMGLTRNDSSTSLLSNSLTSAKTERGHSRRSSVQSTATEDSNGDVDSNRIRRWFGAGVVEKFSTSFTKPNNRDIGVTEEDLSVTDGTGSVSGGRDGQTKGGSINSSITGNIDLNSSFTDHHAKSRANFMKRNVSHATTDTESFRNLQRRMKERGAVTGNAVVHMLQEAAEEHAVTKNNDGGELDSNDGSIDILGCLDESESFLKPQPQVPETPLWNVSDASSSFNVNNNNDEAAQRERIRLERDPMFGNCSSGSKVVQRPYINIPSRKSKIEALIDVMANAADLGENRLLTIRGRKFAGKTMLLEKVIDTVQTQGMGYTVLSSTRTANDVLTSFFAFREITSMALRACDAVTQRSNESVEENNSHSQRRGNNDGENGEEGSLDNVRENDESIVQRLVQRKILNKSDQLMIGRILPNVMDEQLLSLLKGRNPTALMKDIVGSLFKIMIPLQPVMLVFEAEGEDCDIDSSSWDLMEEMLLSAGKQCPQMLLVAVSRHSLLSRIPISIANKHVDVQIEQMDKDDTEYYVRALFCDPNCIDRNMVVDSHVVDGVFNRALGCPLFTERIVLWSQRNEVIELDETRNAVAVNLPIDRRHDNEVNHNNDNSFKEEALLLKTLPANLNEEILEVINNLPHHLLDVLKVAACIGIEVDVEKYQSLKVQLGFNDSLQEVTVSHGIFIETNRCYRWKHVAVYEAVESIIISNERIEIQGRIADSLQNLPDFDKGNNAQYARHYAMAERWDDAFDRYMEAGDKAEEKLDFVGAVGMYEQAKICLQRSHKKPSLRRKLSPHAALGWCLRELVRYEEAEAELEYCLKQTLAVPERRRNAQFKEIELDVITTLATLKQAQSKYSEAMEMYERALPIARANKEKHSRVWLAHHVASCAEIHRKAGDLEQAKTLHTEALGYRELAVEEKSCTVLELALSFTQLGCTLSGLGDHSRAYNLHKKALAARVDHLDFESSLVSESLNYCADSLQALGRGGDGIPLGQHAVKIRKFVFGPHHPAYAHALSVLASCYHSVGRSFDSLNLLKDCLAICEKAFSKNHANMIPNLMLYGSVLRVSGNNEKAKDVYDRALGIHKMNFKEGQNAQQLVKLQNALKELSRSPETQAKAVSLEMPIPPFEPDISKTHVILCVDMGHRASDEYMISVAASLQKMGTLKLLAVIAVSPPQVVRADIARGAMDSLLLSNIPVAYSGFVSVASSARSTSASTFNADYGQPSPHVSNTGVELITQALLKAPDKSLVIMCTACLGDVSEVIGTHQDLFAQKMKQLVVLGSVKPTRRKSFIEPDGFSGEKESAHAMNVYQSCQDLGIPTVTLFKDVSRGFPFPSTQVDDLTSSNHMVSTKIQRSEEMHMNGVWELIKQLKQETKSCRTPKSVDIKSFYKYSLGGKAPNTSQHNIWPLIKSINLELVLGLLSCIPMYQDAHFRWETHQVKGIEHRICRHSNSSSGIINPEALSNEIHMLIGFSLRTSLLNTSC